jgi:CBS domain-containing protein
LERFLLELSAEVIMDIRELMTAPAHTVSPEATLDEAASLMRQFAIGCVLVVDEDGKLAGIITDRDIALGAHWTGEALWRLRIADYMRQPVHSCRADEAIDSAVREMRKHRVRRLAVVDASGHPIGLLSLDDLVHGSRQPMLDPTPGLTADEIDDTMEAVSGRSRHARMS